jgi:alpha-tubulin suppressor-like RCC1 family protein
MRKLLTCILVGTSIAGQAQHYTAVESGCEFSVALRSDSTVWVWGYNANGQLGDGTTDISIDTKKVDASRKWIAVAAGSFHRLGIAADSTLWACGLNGNGQLGLLRTTDPNPMMTPIGSAHWKFVAGGMVNSAAIRTDGTLWVAGSNYFGLLGTGDTVGQDQFMQVGVDKDWKSVTVGFGHILAIKNDGTLWGWGANSNGELGLGFTSDVVWVPSRIGSDADWLSASAGTSYSVAMKTDGSIYSVGINDLSQLGRSVTGNMDSSFVQIGTSKNWKIMSAGVSHAFAIDNSGELFAWGANQYGQAGVTASHIISNPTQIGSDTNWNVISASKGIAVQQLMSYGFSTGIKAPGKVICTAGANLIGQLGNGTAGGGQAYFDCIVGEIISKPTGVSSFSGDEIKIYPNPASTNIYLEDRSGNMRDATIMNIQGQILQKLSGNSSKIAFSIESLQPGIYIVRVEMKDGSMLVKKIQKN